MIVLSSSSQLKRWDQTTIKEQGISSAQLMERAAQRFCHRFVDRFPPDDFPRIAILVGPGNNGGDGACIARILEQRQYFTSIYAFWNSPEQRSGDLTLNWHKLEQLSHPRLHINDEFPADAEYDIIIDALFGAGLSRALESPFAELIHRVNQSGIKVIAVDMPSGMAMDHQPPDWPCIQAHETFSFAAPKLSSLLPGSSQAWGRTTILDIGLIPFPDIPRSMLQVMDPGDKAFSSHLPPRKIFTHKGTYGHVLILAGSKGHAGAALLAARGAYRAGAGLVTVYGPARIESIIQIGLPEAMFIADPESDHIAEIPPLDRYDAVVFGPGIGQAKTTRDAMVALLQNIGNIPLILDADALNLLAANPELYALIPAEGQLILTPHPGEFKRLLGEEMDDSRIFSQMEDVLRKLPGKQAVLLLKNQYSIALSTDGRRAVNIWFGNPGMATGGTGDTLCGAIAACAARGMTIFDATCLAVMAHGYAGDLASGEKGQPGMLASDLGDRLGLALTAFGHAELSDSNPEWNSVYPR